MVDNKQAFCVVLTTTNNEANKNQIIKALLMQKLAACIQEMAINSHYVWQGEVCQDVETLLVIKTRKELYPQVEDQISQLHNYEVPQIVQLEIQDGFNPYLSWITANTLELQ